MKPTCSLVIRETESARRAPPPPAAAAAGRMNGSVPADADACGRARRVCSSRGFHAIDLNDLNSIVVLRRIADSTVVDVKRSEEPESKFRPESRDFRPSPNSEKRCTVPSRASADLPVTATIARAWSGSKAAAATAAATAKASG